MQGRGKKKHDDGKARHIRKKESEEILHSWTSHSFTSHGSHDLTDDGFSKNTLLD